MRERGGATPLSRQDKCFGGIFWEKIIRYYDTKAVRSNRNVVRHYYADRKICCRVCKPDLQLPKAGQHTGHWWDLSCHPEVPEARHHVRQYSCALPGHCEGATHVDMSDNIRRVAFTLAEVLITLGIIGIVAAMTIPTLVKNYQEKVMVTKVKQAHSQLMNAIQLYVAQNNCQNILCLFDTSKTSDEVAAELASVIKTAKICKSGDNDDYCKSYALKSNSPYNIDGIYAASDAMSAEGRIYLPNGIIFCVRQKTECIRTYEIIIRDENGDDTGERAEGIINSCAVVYFDTNNTNEPNQFGADVFRYDVQNTGIIVPNNERLLNNALLYNKLEYTPYNISDSVKN